MDLTDEQEMLRESARGVLDREASITAVRASLDAGDRSRFMEIEQRQGWLGVGVPEEQNGEGGGPIELAILAEEVGRAVLPGRLLTHSGVLAPTLLAVGDTDLLPEILSGDRIAALVLTADCMASRGEGVTVAPNGRLNGAVASVLDADDADILVVPASGGLHVVARQTEGVFLKARPLADRTRRLTDASFTDVPATEIARTTKLDFEALAALASLLVAADALGSASRMLEMTVEYVKDRKQFGQPVGSFQAVKHLASDMLVNVEMSRSAVYHAASSLSAGLEAAAVHAFAAKAFTTEAAAATADAALGLHGAIGYTWEHDLHLYFKRAKLDVALWGTPAAHRERVATALGLVE